MSGGHSVFTLISYISREKHVHSSTYIPVLTCRTGGRKEDSFDISELAAIWAAHGYLGEARSIIDFEAINDTMGERIIYGTCRKVKLRSSTM